MKRKVYLALLLVGLLSLQSSVILRVPAQVGPSPARRLVVSENAAAIGAAESQELSSEEDGLRKLGRFIPPEARLSLDQLKQAYGDPDAIVFEKYPKLPDGFNIQSFVPGQSIPPVTWERIPVYYYGATGYGVDEQSGTVLFETNRDEAAISSADDERATQSASLTPAQATVDGNWIKGTVSSNVSFTIIDDAITNATINNIRYGNCPDGGLISSSFSTPIQVEANEAEFTVVGITDSNIWIVTVNATFTSDSSASLEETVLAIGACGFLFGVTSSRATRLPNYVLFTKPGIRSVLSGESTSFSVGVKSLGGFNQPVQVQMIAPTVQGVNLSFPTTTIQPGGASPLNITTASNTPSVLIGILFTSSTGQATHNVFALLDLDTFELTISPDRQVVGRGQSASFTLNSRTALFKDPVSLTASVSPSSGNIGVSLASSTLIPGQSITFTASSTASTPLTTYDITIRATSGAVRQSTFAEFKVSDPDFELALSPDPQRVGPGGSTDLRVEVRSLVGFNQPVALTASVSPADGPLTASLASNSVVAGGNTNLTVRASSNAQINSSFTVRVSGTSGPFTRSASATVRVSAPDFSLAFNPSTLNVVRGSSATAALAITRIAGFTGPVNITSPNTSDLKIKVKPREAAVTESSKNFKLKVKGSAPTGARQLTFTGRDGSGRERTASLTLVIQ